MMKMGLELFIPLILSNILHMFVVKGDYFQSLKVAIAPGLFGPNKTYRGFVFVMTTTAIFQFLFNSLLYQTLLWDALALGASLGFVYMLFELPNSFLKRRLGIAAGSKAKTNTILFTILDKSDSTFGVCLFFVMVKGLPFIYFIYFFLGAFLLHLGLSQVLYSYRVKESL